MSTEKVPHSNERPLGKIADARNLALLVGFVEIVSSAVSAHRISSDEILDSFDDAFEAACGLAISLAERDPELGHLTLEAFEANPHAMSSGRADDLREALGLPPHEVWPALGQGRPPTPPDATL